MDAGEVGARAFEAPDPRARRDEELVEGEALAPGAHRAGFAVDRFRAPGEAQVDPHLVVEGVGLEEHPVEAPFAGEVFLGEGRALVRGGRLLAEEHDSPREPKATHRLDGLGGGLPAP